ncbi:uncharacterized protein Tco025E_06077 [Trypanosoma conorhini]|uniref:Uncharacterized protein n=1 Tax=Trypanosoma conorhini TaxID=83891 RepID=A0A3R7MZY9_9TRYP|nr:uncharacterized protein Tco025E_06077 [Trypanosoma conorhini]RNF13773.1 hypothetical protein Tco025E_06077 [Trypanosoma conorhini]
MKRLKDLLVLTGVGDDARELIPADRVFSANAVYIDLYSVMRGILDDAECTAPAICRNFSARLSRFFAGVLKITFPPFSVKNIIFVHGASDSLEDAPFSLEVYRQARDFVRGNKDHCRLYFSPEAALEGAAALMLRNGDAVRAVLCSSDPHAPFLGYDCVRNLESWCEESDCCLEVIASARLAAALRLKDCALLPTFTALLEAAYAAVCPIDVDQVVSCLNSWDGLLCPELLEEIGLSTGDAGRADLANVSVFLWELRGGLDVMPVEVAVKDDVAPLPLLLRQQFRSVIRMGDRRLHECFSGVRKSLLYALMPGRLLLEVYGDGSVQVAQLSENDDELSNLYSRPLASAPAQILRVASSTGEEAAITPAELDTVRRLSPELQLGATSLLLLRRMSYFSEETCLRFCHALTFTPAEGAPEADMREPCRVFQVCLTYVTLVNEALWHPRRPPCLSVGSLVDLSALVAPTAFSCELPGNSAEEARRREDFSALRELLRC